MQTRGVTRKLRRFPSWGPRPIEGRQQVLLETDFKMEPDTKATAVVQDGFTLSPRDSGKCCLIRRCVTYTKLALVVENRSARKVVSVSHPVGRSFKFTPPPS